jgi:type I restriction enzyme M protein
LRKRKSRWTLAEQRLFRSTLTRKDPRSQAVLAGSVAGDYEADPDLRDFENVPLTEDVDAYFEREVRPYVSDAWMDRTKDKIGYEIDFNRRFYTYKPSRTLDDIDAELKRVEAEISMLLKDMTE